MSEDVRGKYWLEATSHIAAANKLEMEDPEFWAATISALVNAVMASAPDSVMDEVDHIMAVRARIQRRAQAGIRRDLSA